MHDILVEENIFRLTKDVENPLYDGRKKYGLESIKELKAGLTILVQTYSSRCLEGVVYNEYVFFRGKEKLWADRNKFTKKLDEAFAEYKSQTIAVKEPKSIMAAILLSHSYDFEEFLLTTVERLVSEGKITPNDLLESYQRQRADSMSHLSDPYKELEKEIV
jgi:hypothetical protein